MTSKSSKHFHANFHSFLQQMRIRLKNFSPPRKWKTSQMRQKLNCIFLSRLSLFHEFVISRRPGQWKEFKIMQNFAKWNKNVVKFNFFPVEESKNPKKNVKCLWKIKISLIYKYLINKHLTAFVPYKNKIPHRWERKKKCLCNKIIPCKKKNGNKFGWKEKKRRE